MTSRSTIKWHPMHEHPRGKKRQVLVYSCYEQWIVAEYNTCGDGQWYDEESRINNEKLWHYVWTELPTKPHVGTWTL